MVTSNTNDFRGIKTEALDAEGVYGYFRLRLGEQSYGFYFDEIINDYRHQDDLYYWIKALLDVVICLSETKYCAISDVEHSDRWIEFISSERAISISVVDAHDPSSIISRKPFIEKKIVLQGISVDKHQMLKEIIDKANSFLAKIIKIEPRFAETSQHKLILDKFKVASILATK
jgi:hypothetical protein